MEEYLSKSICKPFASQNICPVHFFEYNILHVTQGTSPVLSALPPSTSLSLQSIFLCFFGSGAVVILIGNSSLLDTSFEVPWNFKIQGTSKPP